MNEELSNRRIIIVAAALAAALIIVLTIVAVMGCNTMTAPEDGSVNADYTTTVSTITTQTSDMLSTTTAFESSVMPATTAAISTTNRYDFSTATNVVNITNFYQVDIEFDGWTLYLDNAIYNASSHTLAFDMSQITTRRNAQPIYYTAGVYGGSSDLKTAERALAAPYVSPEYREMDHLQAKKVRVVISDVPEDFKYVYLDLETLSVADDAGANAAGDLVYKTIAIRSDHPTRVK